MRVTTNIKSLLESKRMRLSTLEKKTNISYQALWSIKKGKTTKISFDTIGKLLEAFKCKPNELFLVTK